MGVVEPSINQVGGLKYYIEKVSPKCTKTHPKCSKKYPKRSICKKGQRDVVKLLKHWVEYKR